MGVMIIAALVFYNLKGGLSQQEQSSVTVIEDSTNKLRLEFPKTLAAAPNFELRIRLENHSVSRTSEER